MVAQSRRIWLAFFTTASLLTAGCATNQEGPFARTSGQNAFANAGRPAPNGSPSISDRFRSTTQSVANALTIQPKVIPADDPVRLSNQPQTVGGDLHYHAARVYDSQGNVPAAMSHYQQAINATPTDTRAMIAAARLMHRQGDYAGAEQLYQQVLAVDPAKTAALNDLGLMYARQGRTTEATDALRRAVRAQPRNTRYRNNLAMCLVDAGKPAEALSYLMESTSEAVANHNVGWFLWKRQQFDQARPYFARAVQLDPRFEQARQMLALTQPQQPPTVQPVSQPMPTGPAGQQDISTQVLPAF